MKNTIEITITKKVTEYEPRELMRDVIGQAFLEEERKENVWIDSHETNDSVYPSFISASLDQDALGLGCYPEISLARLLKEEKDIDSVVSHYGLIDGLDPHDPFWGLAYEEKKWFLSSSGNSLLEFEDGAPGIRRVADIDLDVLMRKEYFWNPEENKLCQQNGGHNSSSSAASIVTP